MAEVEVPIGQVKRDISDLVNQVAYGGKRVILTSRGRPKAALISIEDYKRLKMEGQEARQVRWKAWLEEVRAFSEGVSRKRGGKSIPVGEILEELKEETDDRIWLGVAPATHKLI